jgi:outer membrane receptor protein involved in Fe transport
VDRIRFEVAGETGPDGETESRELVTQTTSLFSQLDIALSDKLTSTLGLRYDSFDGDALDKITDLTDIRETESPMEDYAHFSPKLGLRYEVSANWQLRASAANGYALPPGEQKYIADIQVDPVDYWQYEVGINGSPAEQWNIDLALFSLDSSGEYQTIGDNFVNFGETNRSGLEAELRYRPASNFELLGLLGVFDSEVEKGANVGNAITGVPEHVATLKASYTPPSGLGGTCFALHWRVLPHWRQQPEL